MKNLTYKWVTNIHEIENSDWSAIFGDKVIKSHAFFRAMHNADFPDVSYLFLLVYNSISEIIAILPCFVYDMDLLDIMIESNNKKLVKKIRKKFPRFLRMKTFTIGSYAASCEYFMGLQSGLDNETIQEIKQIVYTNTQEQAKKNKAKLTILKEVRESQIDMARSFFNQDFFFFRSFPNTFIPSSDEFKPYPIALKKKHRKRYVKLKEVFDTHFEWEISDDFERYSEVFGKLYRNVLNKAKNKFEILNWRFFYNMGTTLPGQTYFLIARDKNTKEIRSMEFIIEESDRLIPLYLGVNYQDDDTRVLYLNTIFKTVKMAEEKNKAFVEFGQTSYYPKVMSGAFVEYIYYGFSSYKKSVRFFIKHIFKYLFTQPEIPPNVYKEFIQGDVINRIDKVFDFRIINK